MTGDTPVSLEADALTCMRNDTVLFSDLSFRAGAGEVLHVSGPNGSGKTSLLRILCGLGLAESGQVRWRGTDIVQERGTVAADLQYLGHANGIKLDLTAEENLAFAARLRGCVPACGEGAALTAVGLAGLEEMPARRLSAGQRRRLALARLVQSPASLWILDEPFTSLDEDGRRLVRQLLEQQARAGGVAVVAAHDSLPAGLAARGVRL